MKSDSKLVETSFRTFPLSSSLRLGLASLRNETERTTVQVVEIAVDDHLPIIVAELLAIGIPLIGESSRPTRLPMRRWLIGELKEAAERTGVPTTRLLAACIERSCRTAGLAVVVDVTR